MTVEDLERRMSVAELMEWQTLARIEAREREQRETEARIAQQARVNRQNAKGQWRQ